MLFSIIVPIYNVEPYLERCVNSLRDQSFGNFEIILVDDESPDGCPAMCDRYAAEDSRIRVIHKKNGGLSDARNAGLEIARGDYVVFVDSDDYIETDTCRLFAERISGKEDILVGDAFVEGGTGNLRHIPPRSDSMDGKAYLKEALQNRGSTMIAWLNVYRRAFLHENGLQFKKGILHEDEEFTPRAFLAANQVLVTGIRFYHYIIREGSITTAKDMRKNDRDLYATCLELEEIYKKIDDAELKLLLLNSLSSKLLSLFAQGRLYQYGKEYIHKDFIKRNAHLKKTRYKAWLYSFSPRVYYGINKLFKKLS